MKNRAEVTQTDAATREHFVNIACQNHPPVCQNHLEQDQQLSWSGSNSKSWRWGRLIRFFELSVVRAGW